MNDKTLSSKKEAKRLAILNSARIVFAKKGFLAVTMKDIILECGISRGGIYLYFQSVDEIFVAAIKERFHRQFDNIRFTIKQNPPFEVLLNDYLAEHKARLLNNVKNGKSLLRAMYEYSFTHHASGDKKLKQEQMNATKATVRAILELGIKQQKVSQTGLRPLADNFMLVVEGLSVLTLTGELNEKQIDEQFRLFKQQLLK